MYYIFRKEPQNIIGFIASYFSPYSTFRWSAMLRIPGPTRLRADRPGRSEVGHAGLLKIRECLILALSCRLSMIRVSCRFWSPFGVHLFLKVPDATAVPLLQKLQLQFYKLGCSYLQSCTPNREACREKSKHLFRSLFKTVKS